MWINSECSKISALLWDYAAQRLSESETTRVERHIAHCSRCTEQADAYRLTVGMLSAGRRQAVPTSLSTWQELRGRLETPERRPIRRSADLLPRLTLAGAGTALAAMLLVTFYSQGLHPSVANHPRPPETVRAVPLTTHDEMPAPETKAEASDVASRTIFQGFLPGEAALMEASSVPAPLTTPVSHPLPPTRLRLARWTPRHGAASARNEAKETYTAQLDGAGDPPRTQSHNFVISPVATQTDAETTPHYVMGSIPVGGGTSAGNGDGAEEGRAW